VDFLDGETLGLPGSGFRMTILPGVSIPALDRAELDLQRLKAFMKLTRWSTS